MFLLALLDLGKPCGPLLVSLASIPALVPLVSLASMVSSLFGFRGFRPIRHASYVVRIAAAMHEQVLPGDYGVKKRMGRLARSLWRKTRPASVPLNIRQFLIYHCAQDISVIWEYYKAF